VLSFEEICDFVRVAVELGVRKVRLTGGEPLVRRGIVRLVEMLAQIDGIEDFAMTTNGQTSGTLCSRAC
jgi:cyclic pyranopterin phosphate synthase